MIDKAYIEELRGLDKKEAKEKLADYAKEFGVDLKKTKSFDNMVSDLEVEFEKLADQPMPEETEGLTISDLIQADDEATGQSVFEPEAKPEAALLIDSIGETQTTPVDIKIEAPIGKVVKVYDDGTVTEEENKGVTEEDIPALKEAVQKIVESEKVAAEGDYVLPDDFSPTLLPIGRAPGYYTLPWWIYQWITENEDWKSRPLTFGHPSAHSTLLTLLYVINRDGQVMIRETRNSKFFTLK